MTWTPSDASFPEFDCRNSSMRRPKEKICVMISKRKDTGDSNIQLILNLAVPNSLESIELI
jgi:hypothetical protein